MRDTLRSALTLAVLALPVQVFVQSALPKVHVYKSPTCGCCIKWVHHLQQHGFSAETTDLPDVQATRNKYGISKEIASCHTALVEGYLIEGHVPAEAIKRLLRERPAVMGLTVPGMPVGSPGMEGDNGQEYHVLTFDKDGHTEVFATYGPRS